MAKAHGVQRLHRQNLQRHHPQQRQRIPAEAPTDLITSSSFKKPVWGINPTWFSGEGAPTGMAGVSCSSPSVPAPICPRDSCSRGRPSIRTEKSIWNGRLLRKPTTIITKYSAAPTIRSGRTSSAYQPLERSGNGKNTRIHIINRWRESPGTG